MRTQTAARGAALLLTLLALWPATTYAVKKKVGQSGMTYLAISMSARENGMGDAATATVQGIEGMWHNPAVVADIPHLAVTLNQVNWLVNSKLYGAAVGYSLGNLGAVALDLTYMDFGDFTGTVPVDRSVDPRGFKITRTFRVEDYAIGLCFARRVSDKFAFGFKLKRLHENLGPAAYVVDEYDDPETGEKIRVRKTREWAIDDWGLDFGTVYDVGWKGLRVAMTMQNFSRDMKYWYEEFQTPMVLRLGLAMNASQLLFPRSDLVDMVISLDTMHPNDYTERVHVGSELTLMKRIAVRAGYKFNHDVETATLGVGFAFQVAGVKAHFDYAYCAANYFRDISRFSLAFEF